MVAKYALLTDVVKQLDPTRHIRFDTTRPGAVGWDLDPTDKVFFFADSGSPGGPN